MLFYYTFLAQLMLHGGGIELQEEQQRNKQTHYLN